MPLMPFQGGAAISLSPELLWSVAGGKIECQPMKGQSVWANRWRKPRIGSVVEPGPQNRAENLMILDLIRNDLAECSARQCFGARELCRSRYQTLQQMVSTVTAQLSTARLADWAER